MFEVALAVDDDSVQGLPKSQDMIKVYDQGENIEGPWRCLNCFNKRF